MKSFLAIAFVFSIFTHSASAQIFQRHYNYLNIQTGEMIDLIKKNEAEGTGIYYNYLESRKKTVSLILLSKETDKQKNGVRAGEMILVKWDNELKPCQVYHLFENGVARVGCQTGRISANIGVDRHLLCSYNVDTEIVIAEVKASEGFRKNEKVTLRKQAGDLESGTTVKIEAIFINGDVLVQKAGLNLLDTSGVLLKKSGVAKVSIKDIEKK
jgi:hypothetical protein